MSHYGRWLALSAIVLASACSRHIDPQDDAELSRDPSLVLQLEPMPPGHSKRFVSVADACRPLSHAARPTADQQAQARALIMRGHQMAMVGNSSSARDLFHRATQLDATNASAAYLAARASDLANDSVVAVKEYCRFLSLAPASSAAAAVRERILTLARPRVRPSKRLASRAAPSRSLTPQGISRGILARRDMATAFVPMRRIGARSATSAGNASGPNPTDSAAETVSGPEATTRSSLDPDSAVTISNVGHRDQHPDSASVEVTKRDTRLPRRHEQHTARDVLIGAAVGGAAGAVIGRDVKGAVIGAATGGLLGVLVARAGGADQD
jgi:hypothetical protein